MADLHAWQDDRRAGLPIADRYVPTDPAAVIHASPSVVTVLAVAEVLRSWAALIGDVGCYWYRDESCTEPDWHAGFDVHSARHFHRRVSAAQRAARRFWPRPTVRSSPR